jgi:hypothetical protein
MAKRKVHGRLKIKHNDISYKIEMRKEGIAVRQSHTRVVTVVPFGYVIGLAKKQMEFAL